MFKKILKILIGFFVLLLAIVSAIVLYLYSAFPKVDKASNLKVDITPQRIERGRYLANHVSVCMDCHSTRDWSKLTGPIVEGTEGKGGEIFSRQFGFPGTFYSKNITPASLRNWTDGEIYRAITSGISKDGTPLFPVMPYPNYATMDTEDIYSIIAYLRTLKPIENKVPASEPDFPFSLILRTIPGRANPQKRPDTTDKLVYGKYLTNAAGCTNCHTPETKGQKIDSMEMAGGFEFPIQAGVVRSSNLTPDKETGIGTWDKQTFINKFRYFASPHAKEIDAQGYNTIMPWTMYAGMTDADLAAIYDYLQKLKPVKNTIARFSPKQHSK